MAARADLDEADRQSVVGRTIETRFVDGDLVDVGPVTGDREHLVLATGPMPGGGHVGLMCAARVSTVVQEGMPGHELGGAHRLLADGRRPEQHPPTSTR